MRPLRDPRDYQEERRIGARITVIQVLFGAVLAVYLMTFWYLQVVRADYYRRLSDSNHLRRVTIPAERGLITDVEERPLVGNRIAFNVRLDREKTENLDALLPRLATVQQVKSDPEDLFDLGDIVGKAGLERQYETSLHGIKGWKEVVVNSHGREMQEVGEGRPPSPGHALRLTIDLDLQRTLEDAYG